VLFAWNGESYQFVTDLLGGGGLGFNLGRGDYSAPRPSESLLLPRGALVPKADRLVIKITEPMEEVCYLDAARLLAYRLPPGWRLGLDERFAVNDPPATGEPFFFRKSLPVMRATNDRGVDVTSLISEADFRAAEPGIRDSRFIGRTARHELTLEFAQSLNELGDELMLMFDGWIEYPYSQTMFAAWQAGAAYDAPSIEALGDDGSWHMLMPNFGYMAGMARSASVPLDVSGLPPGTRHLRISTNQEIYWDRLSIAVCETCTDAVCHEMKLVAAEVRETGFASRVNYPQHRPGYDYQRRLPLWDVRFPDGYYTEFGPMMPLVSDVDDAVAIIGPGEELHLEFAAEGPSQEDDGSVYFVLQAAGWCKDMDLFTLHGETVGPLPRRSNSTEQSADGHDGPSVLHAKFNTRYRCGG
jgi:hypothetical protein